MISPEQQIRLNEINKREEEISKLMDNPQFKNDFDLQRKTYKEYLDLCEEKNKIEPFNRKKRLKIEAVKQIYELSCGIQELQATSMVKYRRAKTNFINMIKQRFKKYKVEK